VDTKILLCWILFTFLSLQFSQLGNPDDNVHNASKQYLCSYGDKTPNSPYQRYFTCFYIILGLLIISAVIGSITELLYDIHQDSVNKRVQHAAVRMKNVKENPNYNKILEFLDVSDKARCV
jgi:hypothetical protein